VFDDKVRWLLHCMCVLSCLYGVRFPASCYIQCSKVTMKLDNSVSLLLQDRLPTDGVFFSHARVRFFFRDEGTQENSGMSNCC